MFADCRFVEKELRDYTWKLERIRSFIEEKTLERYPDRYLLWNKKVERERIEGIKHEIDSYFTSNHSVMEKVASLKSQPKLRTMQGLKNNPSLRTQSLFSIKHLLTGLPVFTSAYPVYRSQLNLLNQYSEAEDIATSLRESSSAKERKKGTHSLMQKMKTIDETMKALDKHLDDTTIPNDYSNDVSLSLIDVRFSIELLCDILNSLAKRVDVTESEVKMTTSIFCFLHSAFSIMRVLKVDEELNLVEKAFEELRDVINGKEVMEAPEYEETVQNFNNSSDKLTALLTETIKTQKARERLEH